VVVQLTLPPELSIAASASEHFESSLIIVSIKTIVNKLEFTKPSLYFSFGSPGKAFHFHMNISRASWR
jgi:hypothetical protein